MRRLFLLLLCCAAVGQVPNPNVAITGTIGAGGIFPLLNGGNIVLSTDANHTLTYTESTAYVISVTSSVPLTTTRALIAPAGFYSFSVENLTTGGQSITFGGATGSVVTIPNGSWAFIIGDGTNYGTNVASPGSCVGCIVSSPSSNQTITQPAGTGLTLNNPFIINASQTGVPTIHLGNSGWGQSISWGNHGQGYNLGNNGSSAQGWTIGNGTNWQIGGGTRGIVHMMSGTMNKTGIGDGALAYLYGLFYGGNQVPSDEAITAFAIQPHQMPWLSGPIVSGGTTGSSLIRANPTTAHGFTANYNEPNFPDGGMLLDTSLGGATANINSYSQTISTMSYNIDTTTSPVSAAWGVIVPSSCTGSTSSQTQVPVSNTCNVTLSTSPASPGSFGVTNGTSYGDACLAGNFNEEVQITSVGTASGGVQSITFLTRYAWNGSVAATIMQNGATGLCGQAFVKTSSISSWPIAYALLGATSTGQIEFSNCVNGGCDGSAATGNIPAGTPYSVTGGISTLSRSGGTVTWNFGNGGIYNFQPGTVVNVTGFTPSDLNGQFTILTNTSNSYNQVITWAQTGSTETSTVAGTVSGLPTNITFFPMAFITGTNGGNPFGQAILGQNTVAFANGHTVVGAPSAQYQQVGFEQYSGQNTPSTGGYNSRGMHIEDQGPSVAPHGFELWNTSGQVGVNRLDWQGSYQCEICSLSRPAQNGYFYHNNGNEADGSSTARRYHIWADDGTPGYGGTQDFDPVYDAVDFSTSVSAQKYLTPQGGTIASASTIAPSNNSGVQLVSGTTAIQTITPPVSCTSGQACTITLIPTGLWTTVTGGNIALASTAVVNRTITFTYIPSTSLWYPSY